MTTRLISFALLLASLSVAPGYAAAGDPEAGKGKAQVCVSCHGVGGKAPVAPNYPVLAGQYADYLYQTLKSYQDGTRSNAIMAGFAKSLSEQDMRDLAAYFEAQEGLVIKDY